jgi:hypothetical protein
MLLSLAARFQGRALRWPVVTPHFARWCVATVQFAAALAVAPRLTAAQDTRGLGPIVLRLPASTRAAGMANAFLAGNDGDALFYNPALLNIARGSAVSVQRYGSVSTAGSLAMVSAFGVMNVGVGVQFLEWSARDVGYREAVRFGASHLSDSAGVAAASTAITFGIGRTVHGHRIGVSAKYVEDRFEHAHDGTVAFDAGVMLPSFGPGNFAVVAQNLGQGLRLGGERGRLPTAIGLGWGGGMYSRFEQFDFGMQTQLTVERGGFVRPAGGAELGYVPIEGVSFIVRAGLRLPRERDEPLATGGLGITVDRLSLDYAIEPFRGGRPVSHRVGIRIK